MATEMILIRKTELEKIFKKRDEGNEAATSDGSHQLNNEDVRSILKVVPQKSRNKCRAILKMLLRAGATAVDEDMQIVYRNGQSGTALPQLLLLTTMPRQSIKERPLDLVLWIDHLSSNDVPLQLYKTLKKTIAPKMNE